ncbi:hypothetical protein [Polynucleobacter sp. JS-JIR-5-A7]|uniref:hypothetical protein n=1 Tax=Polynucleobacter sp. JS-JIR-5-A7 TaxID=1758395 RepID=UPI001BFEEAB4|nr:hypothetical protein [Polynucleobacter sp. JS-JIR-5-A7]QWE06944.1 hypothetical protein AOC29_01700 [Polynucleobacter sp. JS-JIR-5-A7]
MGPVTDPKHDDLLSSWGEVDRCVGKYFKDDFRSALIDSNGRQVKVSWFPVSWSGFTENPVKRDFGWFTIYDHLEQIWGHDIAKYDDGIYWMYNHPDKSGVGNAWGLEWLHGCNYMDILNRMILHRGFFPGAIQIPTADTESTNFVENFFPFELSNRASKKINWENIEADGRKTKEILKWDKVSPTWKSYHPDFSNHQGMGEMHHHMFRILDIKTRIMSFPEEEIMSAYESCAQGHDVIIAGYEHDFRDRADAVKELFLSPINRMSKKYPKIKLINSNFHNAARAIANKNSNHCVFPMFEVSLDKNYIQIKSNIELYNSNPYVAVEEIPSGKIYHVNPTRNGYLSWAIQSDMLPSKYKIGVAAFSKQGLQSVNRFEISSKSVLTLN